MAAAGVGMKGLDSLVDGLDAAAHELADLPDAHREVGQLLTSRAQTASPRRTGVLAASHGATVQDDAVLVTATAPYAGFVHARNPWLADTLQTSTEELLTIYATTVSEVVAHI